MVEAKRHPADFALWKLTAARACGASRSGTRRGAAASPAGTSSARPWPPSTSATGSTSTPAASTTSACTTPTRWPRASARSACTRGSGWWVHTEFLDLGGAKISKSKGDVLLVDTLVERGIDPLAFRYFTLQAHYRQQQAFTFEAVEAAGTALRRLHRPRGRRPRRRRRRSSTRPRSRRTGAASGPPWPTTSTRPRPSPWCRRWPRTTALAPADKWAVLADADRALGFGLADAVDPDGRRLRLRPPHRRAGGRARGRPRRARTSPPPTASATSWPPRGSRSSTPPTAPPGAAADQKSAELAMPAPQTVSGALRERVRGWVSPPRGRRSRR